MRYASLLLALLIVSNLNSGAQTVDQLTVEECVRLGLQNNRSLRTAQLKANQAEARQDEAFSALLPSLKAAAGYTRVSDVPDFTVTIPLRPYPATMTLSQAVLNNYQAKLSLQQPLFAGNRLTSNYSLQRSSAMAARQEAQARRGELALEIKAAYWNLYQAHQVAAVVDDNIRQVEAHLRDVENLAKQGMATDNDQLKVQLQLSNARLMRIDAANAIRVAEIGLNNLTGRPLESAVMLASAVDTAQQESAPLAVLQQQALAARPELKAMQGRVTAGNAGVTAAQAGWYPQVFGTASYTYAQPNQRIFPPQDRFDASWDVGVALSVDVWNWKTTAHQVAQAKALRSQAEEALAQARDGVMMDVDIAYLDLQKCREKIEVTRTGVAQATENFRTTDERFKNGLATNTDLLDAENLLLQAELNHTRALVEQQIARARMEKAVGK